MSAPVYDLFNYSPPPSPYGTEPYKLRRNDSPDTSHAAARAVNTTRLEAMVHREIHRRDGCIAADLLERFHGHPYSSITARFKALQDKGLISCGPETRTGPSGRQQRVMRSLATPT